MKLVRHRPTIRLRAPLEVEAGTVFEPAIVLDARRNVGLEYVDVTLLGTEVVRIAVGEHAQVQRRHIIGQRSRLTEGVPIPSGRSILPCRFILPADLPATYSGRAASIHYSLQVHASVPWWPDARASFEIFVRRRQEPAEDGRPRIYSNAPEGPRAREPHAEASLATDVVEVGGVLSGAVALWNCDFNRYSGVKIHLVGEETVRVSRYQATTEFARYRIRGLLRDPADGVPLSFALRVPAGATPSGETIAWSLAWYVEVEVERPWAKNLRLRCPIVIKPEHGAPGAESYAPPPVGSPRLEAVWELVGRETEMTLWQGCLRAEVDDVTVELRREHRGGKGLFVVGALRYPSLDLGLVLRSARHTLRGSRIELDGRERAQITPIGDAVAKCLAPRATIDMGDEHARIELRNGGQDYRKLVEFARSLMAVARAFVSARALVPPPTAMAAGVESWRRLADRMGGRLDVGRMAIEGIFQGRPATVATTWGAGTDPRFTVVVLRAPYPLRTSQPHERFLIGDDDIRAELPAPLLDPAPALEALCEMSLLCEHLGPRSGAYR